MNLRESFNKAKASAKSGGFNPKKAGVGNLSINSSYEGSYVKKKRRGTSSTTPSTRTTRSNMEKMLGL